jgi:class 3 adenylate cyclase
MRYLKATLLIGAASALVVLLLTATGWLTNTPDKVLQQAYGLKNAHAVSLGWQIAVFTLLAFAAAWTTVDITRPALKAVVAVGAILLLLTWSQVLSLYKVFYSPFPAVAAVLISFLIGLAYGRSASGARKRIIERLFAQRVSKGTFAMLVNSDVPADFPGDKVEGTVVVCEVENHEELMELLTPGDYAAMTNLYLQTASDYLVEVGGYLDECTGESLRVAFGVPLPDDHHASRACRAALDLLARLDILNKECDATWQRRFDFRMGVNSGEMIGAAYGGTRLASFSVAGPAVEFARRLSAACAVYGSRILMGPETFEAARDAFEVRPIEVLRGLGGMRRAELYEVLAPKNGLSAERERSRDHFWRGVIYYREKKWAQAVDEFQQARITGIPDAALDFYIRRVEKARRGAADAEREPEMLFGRA